MIELRRGDSFTLDISDLAVGDVPTTFQAGDVLIWTGKAGFVTIVKTSADGGVTFDIGSGNGQVHGTPDDWPIRHVGGGGGGQVVGVCDLQLARVNDVFTLDTQQFVILDDVTK